VSRHLSYWLPKHNRPTSVKGVAPWPRWIIWSFFLPTIVLNGWVLLIALNYFAPIVTKFVTATLLAFVLSYPVKLFQRLEIPRTLAVLLVLVVAIAVLGILGVTLVPTLIEQANALANYLPTWVDSSNQQLKLFQGWAEGHHWPISVSHLMPQLRLWVSTQLQTISGAALRVLLDVLGSVLNLMLTLILTFYLLLHGERLWQGVFQWLPSQKGIRIQKIVQQNFQNYYIGQFTLALLMGITMTTMFVVIQVPFGLLFGMGIGVLALFPFGAAFGIVLVSLLILMQSIWLGLKVLVIATLIDQVIENGIAPQLMGRFTGLNPIWVLISLLVGVKIAGLLGLVVAVPFASSIKSWVDSQQAVFQSGDAAWR
jgi:predicted PurR-regulated permease PerM